MSKKKKTKKQTKSRRIIRPVYYSSAAEAEAVYGSQIPSIFGQLPIGANQRDALHLAALLLKDANDHAHGLTPFHRMFLVRLLRSARVI